MRRYRTRIYFKNKEKDKKPIKRQILGVLIIAAALLVLYCLIMPNNSGVAGHVIAKKMRYMFGLGYLIAPLLISWIGVRIIREKKIEKPWHLAFSQASVLWIATTFLSLITQDLPSKNLGGFVGKYSEIFLEKALGVTGAYLLLIILLLIIINFSLSYPPLYLFKLLKKQIEKEWQEWQEIRKLSKAVEDKAPIIKLSRKAQAEAPEVVRPDQGKKLRNNLDNLKKKIKEKFIRQKPSEPAAAPQKASEKPIKTAVNGITGMTIAEKKEVQEFKLPNISLLSRAKDKPSIKKEEELVSSAAYLESVLASFNIQAKVTDINPGPVITRYDIMPGIGVKVGSIINLSNDIALSMKAPSIRVVAPVPGKAAVGIEIPNSKSELVTLSEIISHKAFQESESLLSICLGKTTEGSVYVADLVPMPHLLVAGATGSGKSVCIHSIIISILFKALPSQVKLMLIDPKRLELPVYNGLPHLYDPKTSSEEVEVITDPREAAKSLDRLVKVMEARYEKFAEATVRNIDGYNAYAVKNSLPQEFYIVVIIDELADLMMIAPREIEDSIQRLAQMARAVGIHLVLATQRPSVDVITGVIKANLPSRIAFQVLSKIDSRVILDVTGADDLIGKGDMLFLASGEPKPIRLQGAFVNESEVENIVNFYKNQGTPFYEDNTESSAVGNKFEDEKSRKDILSALQLMKERRRISQDLLKANFGSSSKASNILSLLEIRGFVKKPEGSNRWEILFERVEEYLRTAGNDSGKKQVQNNEFVLKESE